MKPWGGIDPNSQHQIWSHWTFTVHASGRHPSYADVKKNVTTWLRKGFGSVGQAKIVEHVNSWVIEARVEGVPADDPKYYDYVCSEFSKFVELGWGPLAISSVDAQILADGKQQVVVIG